MANYDLTHTSAQYLDKHLVLPMLEFLEKMKKDLYSEEDLAKAKLALLSKTNMVDFVVETYQKFNKEVPSELKTKREAVLAKLKELKQECAPILQVLDNQALVKQLRGEKLFTPQYLEEKYQVTANSIESLYNYAKFQFDCGIYSGAADSLHHYRALTSNADRSFSALWGKLAAEILMANWEDASKDIQILKDAIDSKNWTSPVKQLQQRSFLLHWSLFVFFNHSNGRNAIIDLFLQDKYLNTIQTVCPHLLRYLTTAVIINKKRRNVLKDLVKVIQQESYTYRDPIIEFLEALYINFDFEDAQIKLRECEKVLSSDFFLLSYRDEFMDQARLFIFETFCRIHQCIDIAMLADKLQMSAPEAEKWIVNLIRNAKLDAKLDSQANLVVMSVSHPSVYQKIIERTKGLSFRSSVLANNLAKTELGRYAPAGDEEETAASTPAQTDN